MKSSPWFTRSARFLGEHRRWGIVALLFAFTLNNNLDRQALAVLAPMLRQELGFGPIEYSYIVAAFLTAYGLSYVFSGRIIDQWGVKLTLAAALVGWSVAGMLHGAAVGWMTLLLYRFMLGLFESFNNPAGLKAITEWIPPRERGLTIAVFNNGYVTGAIIAPPLIVFLVLHVGWRWGFVINGALGFLLLVVWWRNYHPPETHPGLSASERSLIFAGHGPAATKAKKLTMRQLMKHPLCVGFFVAQLLTDPIAYFFSFWLPTYLGDELGFSLAMIGVLGWLPYVGYDIGGPGGGALSDWLVRRGWNSVRARRALMLGAAGIMLLANLAVRANTTWLTIAVLILLFAAQSCWKTNLLSWIAESVPRESVATLASLSALGGSIGGVVSNLVAGRAIAAYGYVPVFTVLSILPLMAYVVLEVMRRRTGSALVLNGLS